MSPRVFFHAWHDWHFKQGYQHFTWVELLTVYYPADTVCFNERIPATVELHVALLGFHLEWTVEL